VMLVILSTPRTGASSDIPDIAANLVFVAEKI
jgi:hypothetical protein